MSNVLGGVGWRGNGGVVWMLTYRTSNGTEENCVGVLGGVESLIGQGGAGGIDGSLKMLILELQLHWSRAYTHTTEQVVLQVESNTTALLNNAEDLMQFNQYCHLASVQFVIYLDTLGSHLFAKCQFCTRFLKFTRAPSNLPRDHSGHHQRQRY